MHGMIKIRGCCGTRTIHARTSHVQIESVARAFLFFFTSWCVGRIAIGGSSPLGYANEVREQAYFVHTQLTDYAWMVQVPDGCSADLFGLI
jgi:hypothetical protein